MTDEEIEKQAEIECKKLLQSEKGYNGISFQEFWEEGAKWGLAEGRKESKEYIRYLKRQRQGGIQKQYNKIAKIKELEKENAQLSKMLEIAINEVLLCGKQMKSEHPSMLVWSEETFRAELEKRVENDR